MQLAARLRVAVLAVLALAAFAGLSSHSGIGRVDADAENVTLVAGGTIAAVAVERRIGILATVHVVERAKEELPCARPQGSQEQHARCVRPNSPSPGPATLWQ